MANTVVVLFFTKYDIDTDRKLRSPRKATREAITRAQGQPLEDTAEEVALSRLDGNGFLVDRPMT